MDKFPFSLVLKLPNTCFGTNADAALPVVYGLMFAAVAGLGAGAVVGGEKLYEHLNPRPTVQLEERVKSEWDPVKYPLDVGGSVPEYTWDDPSDPSVVYKSFGAEGSPRRLEVYEYRDGKLELSIVHVNPTGNQFDYALYVDPDGTRSVDNTRLANLLGGIIEEEISKQREVTNPK